MESIKLSFGVLCLICFLHIGVWSQKDVTVSVPHESIEVKPGGEVDLECFGSEPSLSYYIKNRITWAFTDMDGTVTNLTDGFYAADGMENKFESGVYKLDYETMNDQYRFRVIISGVTHADNGIYKCFLIGERTDASGNKKEVVLSEKSVEVTVLNPVESLKLMIKGIDGAESTHPIVEGDMPIKVKPGQYEVVCMADGSNPAPIMSLMYNEQKPYIVPESRYTIDGKQKKYSAKFHLMVNFEASLGLEQTLLCTAVLPDEPYPLKTAGLKLHVSVDEPDIVCGNMSVKLGNKQQKLSCNLTTEHGIDTLVCSKVAWKLPEFNVEIPADGDTKTRRYSTDDKNTYEAYCFKDGGVMKTTLTIYEVKPVHFDMLYYVKYDKFEYPVQLYEIVSSAHSILPSLLTSIAVVLVSKLLSKTL